MAPAQEPQTTQSGSRVIQVTARVLKLALRLIVAQCLCVSAAAFVLQGETFDSILQRRPAEIEQQSLAQSRQPQVRQDLGVEDSVV